MKDLIELLLKASEPGVNLSEVFKGMTQDQKENALAEDVKLSEIESFISGILEKRKSSYDFYI